MAGTIRMQRDDQIEAVGDATRRSLLRRLMAAPSTISQLGVAFGKHPAWIRHHVMRLVEAGLVELAEVRQVRNYTEKYYRATAPAFEVHMLLSADSGTERSITVVGSNDTALDAFAVSVPGVNVVPVSVGSLDGLIALRQGLADIAACHLFDSREDDYNVPYVRHLFADRSVVVLTLVHREQGVMVAAGNPLRIHAISDIIDKGASLANRNPGSGTRLWLDAELRALGADTSVLPGYATSYVTHGAVAQEVARGCADVAIGIRSAAEKAGLDFRPLTRERFDLVIPADRLADANVSAFIDELETRRARTMIGSLSGYDVSHTGDEVRIAV
ncbi:MAG: substrate-binding domain-containing protein [Actinomycetota bacterium]|nr:MAG: molybdopterin [Actinomycetota bacterium]MDO8949530.1 substrate-binding domain-containing protein [Actinomycetota bacterium]MDP3630310.1 substrate-binding domain-containing protein [Actinomycetota bacterium]